VRVNESKTPEMTWAEAKEAKIGDENASPVPCEDVSHAAPAVDEKAKLTVDFPGQLGQATGRFRRDDLLRLGPAPAQALDAPDLIGLKSCGLSLDFGYGMASRINILESVYRRKKLKWLSLRV